MFMELEPENRSQTMLEKLESFFNKQHIFLISVALSWLGLGLSLLLAHILK